MNYLLYNPISCNGRGMRLKDKALKKLKDKFDNLIAINQLTLDFESFKDKIFEGDNVIVCGGDGTLNHFVNMINKYPIKAKCFMYALGTGNDFFNDLNEKEFTSIDKYIYNLPKLKVNNSEYLFINNVGYGLDGETCRICDESKKNKRKKNYRLVALKLLLKSYKPRNCKICVDGITKEFENVFVAPTMHGRYYGGGMMVAPDQIRGSHELTLVIVHSKSRLKVITHFPKIFKGKHTKYKDIVEVIKGKNIKVSFDVPCALQYDGETINNVLEYECTIE